MPYANLNLEGRLVNDPEFKQGKDNHEFCTFRVAVNQWHGDQEQATFFNCTGGEAMSGRIKKAGMKKGRMVHITGDLVLRETVRPEHLLMSLSRTGTSSGPSPRTRTPELPRPMPHLRSRALPIRTSISAMMTICRSKENKIIRGRKC